VADADDLWNIRRAVEAARDQLKTIPAKERDSIPSGHFGDNYNQLRQEAMRLAPDVRLWPPEVPFGEVAGQKVCQARYIEIQVYLDQIFALLPGDDSPMGFVG
jgi:hypothetical protein